MNDVVEVHMLNTETGETFSFDCCMDNMSSIWKKYDPFKYEFLYMQDKKPATPLVGFGPITI